MTKSVLNNFSWVYRGEGNANLVLALPENRLIVRIRKADNPTTFYEKTLDFFKYWLSWEEVYNVGLQEAQKPHSKKYNFFDHVVSWMVKLLKSKYRELVSSEVRDWRFYREVIRNIIGPNYACDCASVYMTKKEVREIEKAISSSRPDFRKCKRLCYGRATILEDFALLPLELESDLKLEESTFSIEIKPKQGWYPICEREDAKCQFCLKQYLKIERGQIESFSSYCPLDLYSGDKKRMMNALHALIENPQNNFKVFKDGQMVYGGGYQKEDFFKYFTSLFSNESICHENEIAQEFCQFLHTVLTRKFSNGCEKYCNFDCICNLNLERNHIEIDSADLDGSCRFSNSKLPRGCVLERIYSMQQLNERGLQYYSDIYKNKEVDEATYSTYIDQLLEQISKNRKCPSCLVKKGMVFNKQTDLNISQYEDEMNLLKYLLFAIARDCSLMITFRKINGETRELKDCIVKTDIGSFAVNVGVIDLSLKPLSTITKAIHRNSKIARAYKRSISK